MEATATPQEENVLLTLQNTRRPDQIVYLVVEKESGIFETRGLHEMFGLKEIRLEGQDIVPSLPEYAQVLSFIFDSISTAQDLNLPYHYQDEFTFGESNFTLFESGDRRILKRADGSPQPLYV